MRLSGLIPFMLVFPAIATPIWKNSLALEQRDGTDLSTRELMHTDDASKKKHKKKKHKKVHIEETNLSQQDDDDNQPYQTEPSREPHSNDPPRRKTGHRNFGCSWFCLPPRRHPDRDLVTGSFEISLNPFDNDSGLGTSSDRIARYQWGPGPVGENGAAQGIAVTVSRGPDFPWLADNFHGTARIVNGDGTEYSFEEDAARFVVTGEDVTRALQTTANLGGTNPRVRLRVSWVYHDGEF